MQHISQRIYNTVDMISLSSCLGPILLLGLVGVVYCHPYFQQRIPNGELVPHPCNPNYLWKGVGHLNRGGGGANNDFGLDFKDNGRAWTQALCQMDSDGDGLTNGQELGDPDCVWTPGQAPTRTAGLSHPGICEPINSAQCRAQASFVKCEDLEFNCPALEADGVFNLTVRLPETQVPAQETTYMCMDFEFPSNGDFHLVANKPIIDNINVMHHVILYGCHGEGLNVLMPKVNNVDVEDIRGNHRVAFISVGVCVNRSAANFGTAYNCFMSGKEGCNDIIAIWAVGVPGECVHPNTGYRVGASTGAYKSGILEMHWNNPTLNADWTDSSGLDLFLTPNLRPYDAGMVMIGQNYLVIPPGEERHVTSGKVGPTCTRQLMNGPVNIVGATNHMHYLGSAAASYITHGNGQVTYIAKDDTFSYDSPVFYLYDDPIVMNPGDEITLDCHFRSTSRTKTTYFGEGTNDEMCFAFVMYYPKENFKTTGISSTMDIEPCEFESSVIKGCDFEALRSFSDPTIIEMYSIVLENCQVGSCRKECKEVVKRVKQHPCFSGTPRVWQLSTQRWIDDIEEKYQSTLFWASLDSCDEELLRDRIDELIDAGNTSAAPIAGYSALVIMTSATMAVMQLK